MASYHSQNVCKYKYDGKRNINIGAILVSAVVSCTTLTKTPNIAKMSANTNTLTGKEISIYRSS